MFSHLCFFARVSIFGSVYSIDEFLRPVNRAGKIYRFKQYETRLPDRRAAFLCKTISAGQRRETARARVSYKICTRRSEGGGNAPPCAEEELTL